MSEKKLNCNEGVVRGGRQGFESKKKKVLVDKRDLKTSISIVHQTGQFKG